MNCVSFLFSAKKRSRNEKRQEENGWPELEQHGWLFRHEDSEHDEFVNAAVGD